MVHVLTTGLLRVELAPEEHQLYSDVCKYKQSIQTDAILRRQTDTKPSLYLEGLEKFRFWDSYEYITFMLHTDENVMVRIKKKMNVIACRYWHKHGLVLDWKAFVAL